MKNGDPSIFTTLIAQVTVQAGNNDTEQIGRIVLMYDDICPPVKDVCKRIVFKEFYLSEEQFDNWHEDNIKSFPTHCAEFVSCLIRFYEPNLKVERKGFYIPNGFLQLSKNRLS